MTKTYVLYHANCPDGFGAAWVAHRKFGDEAEYIPVSYGSPPPAMDSEADVFILDFSYPRETLIWLNAEQRSLRVLDHHKSAQAALDGLEFCIFDMDKSGAMLAWEHFFAPDAAPPLIHYVQDRDLWRFKITGSREVSAWMGSWPFTFERWDFIEDRLFMWPDKVIQEGGSILRAKNQMVEAMCRHAGWAYIGTYRVPVANATVYFSEVGERLCELNPDAPFAAYFSVRLDGKRQWGLRARGDFDCSVIAGMYGGGGHPGAAGFLTGPGTPWVGGPELEPA